MEFSSIRIKENFRIHRSQICYVDEILGNIFDETTGEYKNVTL